MRAGIVNSVMRLGPSADALVSVPAPDALEIRLADSAQSARRSASGRLLTSGGARTGENAPRVISARWTQLPENAASRVLSLCAGRVYAAYPDPCTGNERVSEFYCADRRVKHEGGRRVSVEVRLDEI